MAEYIEREALLKDARKNRAIGLCEADIVDVQNLIHSQPTADVAPVVHGQWYINSDGYYPYCSECKNEPKGGEMTDYCPNCGAKMDGGETE